MRPVFHKFLKFRKFRRNFRDTEVYGWGRQILKKKKKTEDTASGAVNVSHMTRSLNYPIGGNFNIHPSTFSMDGRFPFNYGPGSFSMQHFLHFHLTLAGPILDQAGLSGILSNRSDSPATMVRDCSLFIARGGEVRDFLTN